MSQFEPFNYKSLNEIEKKIKELDVDIRLSRNLDVLAKPVKIGSKTSPNSIAILPMEGCDSNPDGSPSELVLRRYERFASGGAGVLWCEACAVAPEGKANPLQMLLTEQNAASFEDMLKNSTNMAKQAAGHRPLYILQLTHSGRYSRPIDKAAPIIPQRDPLLDPRVGIDGEYDVVTDTYLDELIQRYVDSALLAQKVGFDGVDIKACHRYLVSELLASHTREGRYGGSFENRSRFLLDTIRAVKAAVGEDFIVSSRFNVYDAHPYPYGFGVDKVDMWIPDLDEPLELVRRMVQSGVGLLSNSAGNPYYRFPQVTRPFDQPAIGGEIPQEHQLESVARMFGFTRDIQKAAGDIPVIGNGYTWLRQFMPYAGAANIEDGKAAMLGIGRQAFAYPNCANDILQKGEMDPRKCCVACSKCTQIMRDHGRTGCVIRDSLVYAPLYKEAREQAGKE